MTELRGLDEVLTALTTKLGEARVDQVVNKSLREVGKESEQDLKEVVAKFRDTGRTVEETTHSNVTKADYGIPMIKIGWRSGSRWRLEHLQEFGYQRNGRSYSPRGMGALQAYIDEFGDKYQDKIKKNLGELVK